MSLEQRKNVYRQAGVAMGERTLKKFRLETNDYFCKHETELIDLTEKIPNWETYLTDRQVEIVKLYLNFRNVSDVTRKLGWRGNGVYNVLFGNYGKEREIKGGVLKKLRAVYQKLQEIQNKRRANI
jgi:hypothetical protein